MAATAPASKARVVNSGESTSPMIDVRGLDPHLMTAARDAVPDGVDWAFLKRSLDVCVRHVDRLLGLDISQLDPSLDDVHHSAILRLVETIAPFIRRLRR